LKAMFRALVFSLAIFQLAWSDAAASGQFPQKTADGSAPALPYVSITRSPTMNAGEWANPAYAYADGGGYASTNDTGKRHEFYGFNFSLVPAHIVAGIVVEVDSWYTGAVQSPELEISLSWDGGHNWSAAKSCRVTDSESTYALGWPTDLWGRSWLPNEINSNDFRVAVKSSTGLMIEGSEIALDWLRVVVVVDENPPEVTIVHPRNKTYNYKTSIPLKYRGTDDVAVHECWYVVDDGAPNPLPRVGDTTFDTTPGSHTLRVFARDFSGRVGSASVSFSVVLEPAQPILVICDHSLPANYYDHYIGEILRTEGVVSFQQVEFADYRSGTYPLQSYDMVILLKTSPLTPREASEFADYVMTGGKLVGIKPDEQLAGVFGVEAVGSTLSDGYVSVDTTAWIAGGIATGSIQYHRDALACELDGAQAVAWLCPDRHTDTGCPAIAEHGYGLGHTVLFTYPLVESVVLLHQGNDALADMTDADGDAKYRPQDYFANGFWDPATAEIPQADEHQALLINAIYHLMSQEIPVPRVWYFPESRNAICLITSDSGGNDGGRDVEVEYHSNIVESYGGCAHYNILDLDMSVGQYARLIGDGHGVSPHVYVSDMANLGQLNSGIRQDVDDFLEKYWAMGSVQTTHRNISVGFWETAQYFADNDLPMSMQIGAPTASAPYYGYMCGTALPFRVVKNEEDNAVTNAWQMPIVCSDGLIIGNYTECQATDITTGLLERLADRYNGVAPFLFHANNVWVDDGGYERRWFANTLSYCQQHSIPIWSADRFYEYWSNRHCTEFEGVEYASGELSFEVWTALDNATIMVPHRFRDGTVQSVSVDSFQIHHELCEVDGVEYVRFILHEATTASPHLISVKYATDTVPVSLFLFEGTASPGEIALEWVTANESGFVSFVVFKSSGGTESKYVGLKREPTKVVGPSTTTYRYCDRDVVPGTLYNYKLEATLLAGHRESYGPVSVLAASVDAKYALKQNTPNPFTSAGGTTIHYSVARAGRVVITIFDAAGRLVATLADEAQAGDNSLTWYGRANDGRRLGAGLYFYEISAAEFRSQRKMVMVE
jgi:hypothetical protein